MIEAYKNISILALILSVFLIPKITFAGWVVTTDTDTTLTPITYTSEGTNARLWFDQDFGIWRFQQGIGTLYSNQNAVNQAYVVDKSPLPTTITGDGFADGLNWPCDWSQFSQVCPDSYAFYRQTFAYFYTGFMQIFVVILIILYFFIWMTKMARMV